MKKLIIVIIISYNTISCNSQAYDPGFDYKLFDNTPVEELAKAVKNDDIDKIKYLINEKKMNVNYQRQGIKYKNTVLSFAIVNQKPETVEALLKCGANPNIIGGRQNDTPFIIALEYTYPAISCDTRKIEMLIKYGAEVNKIHNDALNNVIRTPLMIASGEGCLSVVKLLIKNGTDPDIYPKYEGYGAIAEALITDNIDIAKYLIIEAKAKIPTYIIKRKANINYIGEPEKKLTITDLLLEQDYSKDLSRQTSKEEILNYLQNKGIR